MAEPAYNYDYEEEEKDEYEEYVNQHQGQGLYNRRMYPLMYHPVQSQYARSASRFRVVPAGRRSGKTEIAKRKLVRIAMSSPRFGGSPYPDPKYFFGAPTRDQAKRIYWADLKAMIPPRNRLRPPSESQLIMYPITGAEIHVLGMDKPERAEGTPWDGGVLDEIGNMKPETWPEHIRPALADRRGWCDFIGVPEGRNHYYKLYKRAVAQTLKAAKEGRIPEWAFYHWISEDILKVIAPDEIESAKADLDELIYQQEFEGSFIDFTGRAYYNFNERTHCARLSYNPHDDLIFNFDFNVAPGTASVVQEQHLPSMGTGVRRWGSGVIGEVFIPRGSNTVLVCNRLIKDWGRHKGNVFVYGDSTGGAKGSAKILGSDWQLIKQMLWAHFGAERVFFRVQKANPRERDRVNSLNSRLRNTKNEIRMMVDPSRAPKVVEDFEGTVTVEGGSGEIDKTSDPLLSHLTDGLGYYTHREYPVKRIYEPSGQKYWK